MSFPHRSAALAIAAFLTISQHSIALAGPDQLRENLDGNHVDAPTGKWNPETNNFDLLVKVDNEFLSPDKELLYLDQQEPDYRGREKHIENFGNGSDAFTKFASDKARYWWKAPNSGDANHSIIFAGYGAFQGGTDKVDHSSIALDVLSIKGPGDVEIANYLGGSGTRLYSSSDLGVRSYYAPQHYHVNTLFTKPGRYEIVYRATARLKDADQLPAGERTITTAPQTIVWQVGGPAPHTGTVLDAVKTYAATPAVAPQEASVTITKSPQEAGAPRTSIAFNTDPAEEGTLTAYIDGYYLYELPVHGGKAEFSQFMGEAASQLQFVYIANDNSKRWATQPVTFTPGQDQTISGSATIAVNPTPHDTNPVFDKPAAPASKEVTVSYPEVDPTKVESWEKGRVNLTVTADPNLRAAYKVGFFQNSTNPIADASSEGTLINGKAVEIKDIAFMKEYPDAEMRVEIIPHPALNLAPLKQVIKKVDVTPGGSHTFTLEEFHSGNAQGTNTGNTDANGNTGNTGSTDTEHDHEHEHEHENTGEVVELQPATTINAGHIDLHLVNTEDGLALAIGDESGDEEVDRVMEGSILTVNKDAKHDTAPLQNNPTLSWIARDTKEAYFLPQTQKPNLVWPGFSTEGLDYDALPDGVQYSMEVASAPAGANVAFYQFTDLDNAVVHLSSLDPALKISAPKPIHMHGNWVFTKPGTYRITLHANSGSEELAPPQTLTFEVDKDAAAPTTTAPATAPSATQSETTTPTTAQATTQSSTPTTTSRTPETKPEPTPVVTPAPAPAPTSETKPESTPVVTTVVTSVVTSVVPADAQKIAELEKALLEAQSARDAAKFNQEATQKQLAESQKQLEESKKQLEDSKKQSEDVKKQAEDAKKQLDEYKKQSEAAATEALAKTLKAAQEAHADAKATQEVAQKELQQAKQELEQAKQEFQHAKQELDQAKQELEHAKQELDQAKQQATAARVATPPVATPSVAQPPVTTTVVAQPAVITPPSSEPQQPVDSVTAIALTGIGGLVLGIIAGVLGLVQHLGLELAKLLPGNLQSLLK